MPNYLHTFLSFLFDNKLTQNIYSGIVYIISLAILLYLFIYSFLKIAKTNLLTKNMYVIFLSIFVSAYIFFSSLQEEPIKKTISPEKTDYNLLLYLIFISLYTVYTTPNLFNYININLSNILITDPKKIDLLLKIISAIMVFILFIYFFIPLKQSIQQITSPNIFSKWVIIIFSVLSLILFLTVINKILAFVEIDYKKNSESIDVKGYYKLLLVFLLASPVLLYSIFSSFDEIFKFIKYNYDVILILINIILFPIIYNNIYKPLLNKYIYIVITVHLFIFLYFFYIKSSRYIFFGNNPLNNGLTYNLLYERIKYIVLFFLLLLFITIIYILDKDNRSGYIKNLHLISLFMGLILIYLFITLDLKFETTFKLFKEIYYDKCSEVITDRLNLKKNNILLLCIMAVFIISFITIFYGIITFPGGFLNDEINSPYIVIMLSLYFLIWFLFIIIKIFPKMLTIPISPDSLYTKNRLVRAYITLVSFIITFITLSYGLKFINSVTTNNNILSSFINVFLIFIIYIIVRNFIFSQPKKKIQQPNIINILTSNFNSFLSLITLDNLKQLIKSPTAISAIVISTIILPYILYSLIKKPTNLNQKSVILLDIETPLNKNTTLATYSKLIKDKIPNNYTYAISCWVYINSVPKYNNIQHTIISYGDNPILKFDTLNNTLLVSLQPYNSGQSNTQMVIKKFPLQKWNNIVINYTPGYLDIFINTKLVFTIKENLIYLETSSLYVGHDNGINGVVNDIEYFTSTLNKNEINSIYKTSKYFSN